MRKFRVGSYEIGLIAANDLNTVFASEKAAYFCKKLGKYDSFSQVVSRTHLPVCEAFHYFTTHFRVIKMDRSSKS